MGDPDRLGQGREAFNRGEYFRAHEIWEEAWRDLEGAERIVVQGLIQIAAGLHHLQQRRPRPGAGLLRKGLDKLGASSRRAPDSLTHLGVDGLADAVIRVLADLETAGVREPDPTHLKL